MLLRQNYSCIIYENYIQSNLKRSNAILIFCICFVVDLKTKANNAEYIKNLIFSSKENALIKIIELIPYVKQSKTKTIIMKILPVLFGFVELNTCEEKIKKCLILIGRINRHPYFIEEKSLLKGWERRFKKFCGHEWTNKNKNENKFFNNTFLYTPGTNEMNDVIGYSELDLFLGFNKWLKYHKLHKYLYFFANLSYPEIITICDEQTIRFYELKVDLHPMTDGARKAILRKLAELNQRTARLKVFSVMEYYTSVSKIERAIYEMKTILKTPIRKNFMFCQNNNIPDLLVTSIQTVMHTTLKLSRKEFTQIYNPAMSLLKLAWPSSFFDVDFKNSLNIWQSVLHSKKMSYSRRKIHQNYDAYAIQIFDVEVGIKAISSYLENLLLDDL